VATERPQERPIGQSIACASVGPDGRASHADFDELLNENKRLREIAIYLSGIIIRDVVGRR
jgi:hypothetical protein